MSVRIKKLRQIDFLYVIVMAAYAFDVGNLKYALAWGISGVIYISLASRGQLHIDEIGKPFFGLLGVISFLFAITAVLQAINGFQAYALNEAVYFYTPIFVIIAYAQISCAERISELMDWSFLIFCAAFIVQNIHKLTIGNIMSINFANSYSPFENEMAFIFLIFECFFLMVGKEKKALISIGLCILCFKRICLISAIIIYVFRRLIFVERKAPRALVIAATAFFVALPVITCLVLTPEFETWFYRQFGITLYELTLSRSQRIEMVLNSDEIKYGLGSVTTFMTNSLNAMHGSSFEHRNLHNDLVQIYIECGLIGSVVFTYGFIKASAVRLGMFVLMCYIFVECYFNHLLGAGTAQIWILIYMCVAYASERHRIIDKEKEWNE